MDRWDVIDGYFWWLADHHNGIRSQEYRRLSRLGRYYKPSPLAYSPTEEGRCVYDALCAKKGCNHP